MCYKFNDSNACCHDSCAVGCDGPLNTDCMGCKALNNNGTCVDYCPRPTIYDSENKTIVGNPNVQECPKNMDIFDGCCVKGCPSGMFSTPDDRNCRPCVGACPKICYINYALSSMNIDKFINCTIVQGKLEIRHDLLMGGYTFSEQTRQMEKIDAISPEDLNKLKNIKRITDYLFVQSMDKLFNLGFLSNLEVIEGQNLRNHQYALDISGTEVMSELGLTNLRQVNDGDVLILGNSNLCYVDSLPWDQIVRDGDYRIENKGQRTCFRQGRRCDSECEDGCWGKGKGECFYCRHYKLDNQCISVCDPENALFVSGPKECSHCHNNCKQCNGPDPNNCTQTDDREDGKLI